MSKVYVGDIGTVIELETDAPLAGGSAYIIRVKKPDNTVEDWPALVTDETKLYYVTAVGDLDQGGDYLLQAYVTLPSWKGLGDTAKLRVYFPWE